MKNVLPLLAFVAICGSSCAQQYRHTYSSGLFPQTIEASDNYVTKELRLHAFEKLAVAGPIDVTYTQKPDASRTVVEVYTSDNIVDLLDIRVKGGTLHISFKKNIKVHYDKLDVKVTSSGVEALSLAGSGDLYIDTPLTAEELTISVAGSGDIEAAHAVTCRDQITVSIAGSGDVKLAQAICTDWEGSVSGSGTITVEGGRSEEAEFSIAGSGDIRATDFVVRRATASIAGSGDIRIHVTDQLDARVSGSGEIAYKGNPQVEASRKGVHRID